jgi:hypothetical protein
VKTQRATAPHIRIYDTVYNSVAFRTLPGSALKLWIDLRTQFRGSNNGSLMVTMAMQKHRGWNSTAKLYKARDELLDRRLIAYTRQCNPNKKHVASLYAFTDLEIAANERHGVSGGSASHAYLTFTPEYPAKRALPKQEPNGSLIGSATVPETGKQSPETVPKRESRKSPGNTRQCLICARFNEPRLCSPDSGNTFKLTRLCGIYEADWSGCRSG